MKGASGFSLPSPNPIPPAPKTVVFIESLFRKCTAHRDRGIAGSEGAVRREAHPLHFLSKGDFLQVFSGKNLNMKKPRPLGTRLIGGQLQCGTLCRTAPEPASA